mmetsp:Transcript_51654/g.66165  ORF Transcript_51654/g.66165 Transcript_51654/m.66165 type:complete len:354 (-) Transcript_51654:91-1152(-)|eukprot:CAMPEP_0114334816 /NCGR_PEP_ID=MMETSP0101-20121206/4636_1 /TAXON_ID=38822 ORGANISM="Pteridomonas danica, Strain PT" /NCGR_SAMPLE_ID=MMETSP0101 /ASSEMBLY_ACC=CAM_ASM_000211 /LENGTH=353 /DNA_ID=CAMNT_0001466219 /DNA_START=238 /DNA_END=1299 /DNA_ORIENTATION=-
MTSTVTEHSTFREGLGKALSSNFQDVPDILNLIQQAVSNNARPIRTLTSRNILGGNASIIISLLQTIQLNQVLLMSKTLDDIAKLKETRTIAPEAAVSHSDPGPVLNTTNCKHVSKLRKFLHKYMIGMPMSVVVKSESEVSDAADIPQTSMQTIPGVVHCMNELRKLHFSKINQAASVEAAVTALVGVLRGDLVKKVKLHYLQHVTVADLHLSSAAHARAIQIMCLELLGGRLDLYDEMSSDELTDSFNNKKLTIWTFVFALVVCIVVHEASLSDDIKEFSFSKPNKYLRLLVWKTRQVIGEHSEVFQKYESFNTCAVSSDIMEEKISSVVNQCGGVGDPNTNLILNWFQTWQ